ncbi:hypothetical protein C8Q74DRAFT_1215118 [Fomes fomentarius]|nr:hypothetical protein C8Q74DRAFT_1215118 [Fomes fomentarius]
MSVAMYYVDVLYKAGATIIHMRMVVIGSLGAAELSLLCPLDTRVHERLMLCKDQDERDDTHDVQQIFAIRRAWFSSRHRSFTNRVMESKEREPRRRIRARDTANRGQPGDIATQRRQCHITLPAASQLTNLRLTIPMDNVRVANDERTRGQFPQTVKEGMPHYGNCSGWAQVLREIPIQIEMGEYPRRGGWSPEAVETWHRMAHERRWRTVRRMVRCKENSES